MATHIKRVLLGQSAATRRFRFGYSTIHYCNKHKIDSDKLKLTLKETTLIPCDHPCLLQRQIQAKSGARSSTSAKRGSKKRSSTKRGSKKRSSKNAVVQSALVQPVVVKSAVVQKAVVKNAIQKNTQKKK